MNLLCNTLLCPISNLSKLIRTVDTDLSLKPAELTRPPEGQLQNWRTRDSHNSDSFIPSKTTEQHRQITLKSGELIRPPERNLHDWQIQRVYQISNWSKVSNFRDQYNELTIEASELTRPPEGHLQNSLIEDPLNSVWWKPCETMEEFRITSLKLGELTRPPEKCLSNRNAGISCRTYSDWTEPFSITEQHSRTLGPSKLIKKPEWYFDSPEVFQYSNWSESSIIMSQRMDLCLDPSNLIRPPERYLINFFSEFMQSTSPGGNISSAGKKFQEKENETVTEEQCGVNTNPEDLRPHVTRVPKPTKKDTRSTITLVSINVQEFKPEEITVKLARDGVLIVEGTHHGMQNTHGLILRYFKRRYVLPANCDASKIESKMSSNGVLIITAPVVVPIDVEYMELPIIQTGQPTKQLTYEPEKVNDILYS